MDEESEDEEDDLDYADLCPETTPMYLSLKSYGGGVISGDEVEVKGDNIFLLLILLC